MITYYHHQNRIASSLIGKYPNIVGGFTTRSVGDCRKVHIIKTFLLENEIPCKKISLLEQIHSVNIGITQSDYQGEIEQISEADGILTLEKNVCICVRTADCVPVLYFDPVAGIIGASHQGWRGVLKQMVVKMIDKMKELGSSEKNIHLIIGPYINACCYDMDIDRFILFMEDLERLEKKAFIHFGERYHVNLGRIDYELARETGIPQQQVDFFPFCTYCDSQRFFSYRRYKQAKDNEFGEMMAYIMMK